MKPPYVGPERVGAGVREYRSVAYERGALSRRLLRLIVGGLELDNIHDDRCPEVFTEFRRDGGLTFIRCRLKWRHGSQHEAEE